MFPHYYSVDFDHSAAADKPGDWLHGWVGENYNMIGSQWSVGMWVYPRHLYGLGATKPPATPFSWGGIRTGENTRWNAFEWTWYDHVDAAVYYHEVIGSVYSIDGTVKQWKREDQTNAPSNAYDLPSPLFPSGILVLHQ